MRNLLLTKGIFNEMCDPCNDLQKIIYCRSCIPAVRHLLVGFQNVMSLDNFWRSTRGGGERKGLGGGVG